VLLEAPKLEVTKEDNEEEDEGGDEECTLYILQPRTYTPQLPSPQPSPRIVEPPSRIDEEGPEMERETSRPRVESSASSVESAAQLTIELAKPRVEQVISKPQAFKPRVVEIGAKTDPKLTPRMSQKFQPTSGPDPAQAPELVIPEDPEVHTAPQRISLRQRISLKTTPPESIQVPPPNALGLQAQLHAAPRAYQAPDSAYGSDMERPAVNSMASISSSLADLPPPFIHPPGMIPSPHSERQFFRPVQASPYSPLQQRPHTSGTIGPHHFPAPPPRNTPSAMGMSIMSRGTTMTHQTGASGGKSIKKKRSAFGWLKKAFSLDEEERAAFEQRKREQMTSNPYYEARSQEFLDGKRIRPRQAYH
jgi:hypothetical protein